jgi:dipeptidyl-peptidase-4
MKYLFIIPIIVSLFSTPLTAQKDTLSLEDAVSQQYRKFLPKQLPFIQWIPNTYKYAYAEGYVQLTVGDPSNDEEKNVFPIMLVNNKLNSKFYYFENIQWRNEKEFCLHNNKEIVFFNYESQEGERFELEENAGNEDVHLASKQYAYTVENNLFVKNRKGKIKQVTDNDDKNIVSGQSIARSEMGITKGTFWSPAGTYLAFYQKDESHVHDYPLLDITATPGELNSIKYPMAGQLSERAKVGVYNVKRNKVKYIEPIHGEENYLTNVCWTPDEEYLIVVEVNRDQKKFWVHLYSAKKAKFIKTLFSEERTSWVEPQHPAYFIEDTDNEFIWISDRDGFANLYHFSIDGKLIRQLTSNQFVVKDIINVGKDAVYFLATGENPTNTLLYSVDYSGNQSLITKEEGTHSITFNPWNNRIIDTYSNASTPNNVQIIDKTGKQIKALLNAENPLDSIIMGRTEIIKLKSTEGLDLYSRLIYPSDFDSTKTYPVLIYVYGGPHAQLVTNSWLNGASLWMHWLAEQGYLVYTLDNRGSANRGVLFEHTIHRRLGTAEMSDQLKGVEFLKSLPYVDGNRLAVHGWSFGGFMTGTLLLKSPETFNVGVAGGPVTDWKYYEIMYGERYMDTPQTNAKGYEEASLINHAKNLKSDLLLIHGTADDVVVMQHNLALVKKFVELGIQVDFFPYPMHKHNVRGKDRIHLMQKVLNFVIDNNHAE